jgi:DNA-binding transcriptional regulator YbjK
MTARLRSKHPVAPGRPLGHEKVTTEADAWRRATLVVRSAVDVHGQKGRAMGGTSKGERRRQALVDAAAELLVDGGFDAVRHRAVAERARLPLASTTYYFGSLEELVSAAVEHSSRAELAAGRRRLDDLAAPEAAGELVELWLDLLLGARSRGGGLDAVLLRYEQLVGAGRRPYLAPLMRSLRPELDELLTESLARYGRRVDLDELHRLVALVDGAVVSALIEADPDPRAAARQMLLTAIGK